MKNLYLLFLLLFLCSCSKQTRQQVDDVLIIDFKLEQNATLFDRLETVFIKLETNETCLIDKTITQLEFASNKLFLLTGGSERLVFMTKKQNGLIATL